MKIKLSAKLCRGYDDPGFPFEITLETNYPLENVVAKDILVALHPDVLFFNEIKVNGEIV